MKGCIIDGVSTVGKSTILSYLINKIMTNFPTMSKFFISEHYTQRMLEGLKEQGKLSGEDVKQHFHKILKSLQIYSDMLSTSKFADRKGNADMIVLLERGVFTHLVSSPSLLQEFSKNDIEDILIAFNQLQIKTVFLKLPEESFQKRIESSVEYRNAYWKQYLESFGTIHDAIAYFIHWQKEYLSYLQSYQYLISPIIIEVNNDDYASIAESIYTVIIDTDDNN